MASLQTACRLSARLARSKLPHEAAKVRSFRTSAASLAAQNFTMPALSPTMTEGNIAAWRVKEGDKFAAGDVLLEIETDKATMDVEAQEDGTMFKIFTGDGAKAVQVGSRIAVIAEEGDDISTLEVPADTSPKQAAAAEPPRQEGSVPKEERTASSGPPNGTGAQAGKAQKQTYPLYPSIVQLLHENGIDTSKVDEIPATGPKGRLLKGDVLVWLGKAKADAAANVQAQYNKLAHLDLSNIKVAEKKPAPKAEEKAAKPTRLAVETMQFTLPVSLASVIEVQKKIQDSTGVFLPLSTFIARATNVANNELPLPKDYKPSADELFNQVLGLDKVGRKTSRGHYVPSISAMPQPVSVLHKTLRASNAAAKSDIFDMLSGAPSKKAAAPMNRPSGLSTGLNMLSIKVPETEEKRAQIFLDKVKVALEKEPGRLVL